MPVITKTLTFLEYLLTQYLGNAVRSHGNGVSYWTCPECRHDSFHTLPTKPEYPKQRAKCWNRDCEFRGDAADMLKAFHQDEPYGERRLRLEYLQQQWEQQRRKKQKRDTRPVGG